MCLAADEGGGFESHNVYFFMGCKDWKYYIMRFGRPRGMRVILTVYWQMAHTCRLRSRVISPSIPQAPMNTFLPGRIA